MKDQFLRISIITVSLAIALCCPISANAAYDMFLKLDNVQGETNDDSHPGEIDVLAWSWSQSGTEKSGSACIQDLSLTKRVDSSSPDIIMAAVGGSVFREGRLTIRKSGISGYEPLVITMTNVRISSYSTGADGQVTQLTENVKLRFDSISGKYTPQGTDGSAGTPEIWDIQSKICK